MANMLVNNRNRDGSCGYCTECDYDGGRSKRRRNNRATKRARKQRNRAREARAWTTEEW